MKRKRRQSIPRPVSMLELKRLITRWTEEALYRLECQRDFDVKEVQALARDEIQKAFMREFIKRFGCGAHQVVDGEMKYKIEVRSI